LDFTKLSYRLLILGYAFLACIYVFATISNSIDNFSGNRNIASMALLSYFVFMLVGIIKYTRLFSWLSSFNFILGTAGVLYLVVGLSIINWFLLLVLLLGISGLVLSVNLAVKRHGI
jgi:hypothetical protein